MLHSRKWAIIWREQWYALMLEVSLRVDFYMTLGNQVFVVNVVVIDLTWEMVVLNVIS
jgi:hypothetical protein